MLINCNEIPLFVRRENGAIFFFRTSACLFGNVLVLVSFWVFFLLAIRPLLLISRYLSRNRNRINTLFHQCIGGEKLYMLLNDAPCGGLEAY